MPRSPASFSHVCLVASLGAALWFAPDEAAHRWRALVRDAVAPGQTGLRLAVERAGAVCERLVPATAAQREWDELKSQLAQAQQRNRRLAARLAALDEQQARLADARQRPSLAQSPEPLLVPQLVAARVLGSESGGLWRSRVLIGAGTATGVRESALVLDDSRPLVDLGADADVATGDAVYAGRCVIGKIAEAGRYSSTVQRMTDAGFSGPARVARRTSRGLSFGPEGTLVGEGTALCRLRHISEPVNVGDEVYTGRTDGVLRFGMFYGTVVRAELAPGATEWSVEIEPAAALDDFHQVQILRLTINPGRLLAD